MALHWFDTWHRTYEGEDPWFVVRFTAPPSTHVKKPLHDKLATSGVMAWGSATWDGRDVELSFTDSGVVYDYPKGYRAFVRNFEKLVGELDAIHPVFGVFFQPDVHRLALADDKLLALHAGKPDAVAELATQGSEVERISAAENASRLLVKQTETVLRMLADPSEAVRKAAVQSIRQLFFWGVYRMKDAAKQTEVFRRLRMPAIAEAVNPSLVSLLCRESAQDERRCVAVLVEVAANDPEVGAALGQLVASWRQSKRYWFEKGVGSPAIAALMVLREQGVWSDVKALAKEALATVEENDDTEHEIAWARKLMREKAGKTTKVKPAKAKAATLGRARKG